MGSRLTCARGLWRDRRGGNLVEYLIVIGLVAIVCLGGFRLFGQRVDKLATGQAECVSKLESGQCAPGEGVDGFVARRGGTPAAVEPGAAPPAPGVFDELGAGLDGAASWARCGPGGCPPGSTQCFAAGTPVLTTGGLRAIESIHEGDEVVARDPITGETGPRRVVATKVTPAKRVVALTIVVAAGEAETIRATEQHPFWVRGRGWVGAGELGRGDIALATDSGAATVASVAPAGAASVYNLEVEGLHTYFVGASRALVHNDCDLATEAKLRNGVHLRTPVWGGHSDDLVASTLIQDPHWGGGGWQSARDLLDKPTLPLPGAPPGASPGQRAEIDALGKKVQAAQKDLGDAKKAYDKLTGGGPDIRKAHDDRQAAAEKLRDALIRHLAAVDALRGGGEIRFGEDGGVSRVKYPGGMTVDVGGDRKGPTSMKFTEPDGTVTRVYKKAGSDDEWALDQGKGDKDPLAFKGKYQIDTDGRIWRHADNRFVLLSPDGKSAGARTAPDIHRLTSDLGGGVKIKISVNDGSVEVDVHSPNAQMTTTPLKIPFEGEARPRIVGTKDNVVLISLDGGDKPHVGIQITEKPWGEGQKFRDRQVPYNKNGTTYLRDLPRGTKDLTIVVASASSQTRSSWISPLPADENYLIPPYWERDTMETGRATVWGWSRNGRFVGDTTGFERQVGDVIEMYEVTYSRGLPVVGTVVMAGETIVGSEITGRKMTGEERAWHGAFAALGATLEFGPLAFEAAQSARAVSQIEKASGLTRVEAKALFEETKLLGAEERALLKAAAEGKPVEIAKLNAVTDRLNRAVAGARASIEPAEAIARVEAAAAKPAAAGAGPAKEAVTAQFGRTNPDLEKTLHGLLDDSAHRLNVTEALKDPVSRQRTLEIIDELAAGRALDGKALEKVLEQNPGKGPLFEPVAREVNLNAGGVARKTAHVEAMKKEIPGMGAGAKPTETEMAAVRDYGRYLKDTVEPGVAAELEALTREVNAELGGGATFSVRTKTADGLIDKVQRMTTGGAGRGVRPDYKVGDVIDGVGGRITVENTEQLAALLEKVNARFGVGEGGRILEIENMYASPKASSPRYRVIPLIVKAKDGKATFELQLTTRRASIAADLDHNIGYKPLLPATEAQKELIKRMQAEAAALEQLEALGRRPLPQVPVVPGRSPIPSPAGLGPTVRPRGEEPKKSGVR